MAYLGNNPTTQNFVSGTDYFNGTGSQTAFTLTRTVGSINDIQVTVNNVVQQPNDAYTISGTTLTMTSAPSAGTNNVYVRYLSTTTQVITPSQNTVSWNTLDSNVQGDLGISYKNKVINGNMVIDQRNAGASVTPASFAYTLDRWQGVQTTASKFSVQQNAGAVTPPAGFTNYLGVTSLSAYSVAAGDTFNILQSVEGFNCSDFAWGTVSAKTVTLSFWVRSSLTGTFGGAIKDGSSTNSYPFSYTISTANTWEQKSVTIVGPTAGQFSYTSTTNGIGLQVAFGLGAGATFSGTAGAWAAVNAYTATGATSVVGTNGATFYITGVQLEVGTQATTFTTAGGSYGAELALCQRYYIQYLGNTLDEALASGMSSTNQNGFVVVALPVTMRSNPTLSHSTVSLLRWSELTNAFTGTALGLDKASPKTPFIFISVASGMTSHRSGFITANNSTSAYVGFSAEL